MIKHAPGGEPPAAIAVQIEITPTIGNVAASDIGWEDRVGIGKAVGREIEGKAIRPAVVIDRGKRKVHDGRRGDEKFLHWVLHVGIGE